MEVIKYWLVSPSMRKVVELCVSNLKSAVNVLRTMRTMDLPQNEVNDLQICTNECATYFGNGLVFNNGIFYAE